MKAKRLLSVVLAVMVVLSCVFAVAVAPTASAAENYNEYEKMLEDIKPENKYGLEATVNEGKILQAFNWSYNNTIDMLETVAEQGFTTIQISPPNEIKMATKGVHVCEPDNSNGWWMFYQPAGFQLNESTDNALGTKAEFVKLCQEAEKYGIKILVDAVINHMGTDDDHVGEPYANDSVDPMDHVNPRAAEFEPELLAAKAFHSPWVDMTYVENMGQSMRQYDSTGKPILNANGEFTYGGSATEKDIEESLTQHCTSGLPDLKTETQLVQDTIYDYLKELIEAGAAGFRFDAAKHIETLHDTYYPSDFWQDTLLKVREEYSDKEIYAYGEILNKCGDGRPFSEYTELMDVTDSGSFWGIKDAVCNSGNGGNAVPKYPNYNFTDETVIQWNESHDTYIDGSTSYFTIQQRNKIWALTAARKTITGVYLARPDDRAGANRDAIAGFCADILLGDANITSWANPEVAAVNQFDNYFGDADEFCRTRDKVAIIERGGVGATLVNLAGTTKTLNLATKTLAYGTYIDAITGNEFTVAEDGTLTGQIGSTGIACIYYAQDTEPQFPVYQAPVDVTDLLASWDASAGEYPVVNGYNTVVFSTRWDSASVYSWVQGTEDNNGTWPGSPMNFGLVNEYGENQFYTLIPEEFNCYIINNNGNGEQTIDLTVGESLGMYCASKNSEGKWTIGNWSPNFVEVDLGGSTQPTETQPVATTVTEPTSSSVVLPTVMLGDADGDERISVKDATIIQKVVADIEVTDFNEAAAEVDGDERITVKDATAIQKYVADIDIDFPVGEMV